MSYKMKIDWRDLLKTLFIVLLEELLRRLVGGNPTGGDDADCGS